MRTLLDEYILFETDNKAKINSLIMNTPGSEALAVLYAGQ